MPTYSDRQRLFQPGERLTAGKLNQGQELLTRVARDSRAQDLSRPGAIIPQVATWAITTATAPPVDDTNTPINGLAWAQELYDQTDTAAPPNTREILVRVAGSSSPSAGQKIQIVPAHGNISGRWYEWMVVGGGGIFLAHLSTCPDAHGIGKVKKLLASGGKFFGDSSTSLDTTELEVQCPDGMFTGHDYLCLVARIDAGDPPYVVIDVIPWFPRTPASGAPTYIQVDTLAEYQLLNSIQTCGET